MLAQKEVVLRHLKENGSITSWEAVMEYGILRLSARISELRDEGHEIESVWVTKKMKGETMRWVKYTLQK